MFAVWSGDITFRSGEKGVVLRDGTPPLKGVVVLDMGVIVDP
jgi:hypothetical protein